MRIRISQGFTLVELLVVISIIGMLAALLLPALDGVREAGRRAVCTNNLHNMALACQEHEQAQTFLPTGGWGWGWAGNPDRGYTNAQPGGWHFAILNYLERVALRKMGTGGDQAGGCARAQIPVDVFICPSRHKVMAMAYTMPSGTYFNINNPTPAIGRSDYAACAGDGSIITGSHWPGPSSLSDGDGMADADWAAHGGTHTDATGVIFRRSMTKMASIRHGIACTYLIGERYISPDYYLNGQSIANDQGWDTGYEYDVNRWTGQAGSPLPPQRDRPGYYDNGGSDRIFGSAHPDTFNMAFCDGSVHRISYFITPDVHRRLGNAKDTQPIDLTQFR